MMNQGHDTTMMRYWASMPPESWYPDLGTLKAAALAQKNASRSTTVDMDAMRFEAEGTNVVLAHENGARVLPNAYAFGQLARTVGAPASFLQELTAETAVLALNEKKAKAKDGQRVKILGTNMGGGVITARAATGPDYGRIWNYQVAELAERINEVAGGTLYNPPCWDGRPGGLWLNQSRIVLFFIDGGSIVDGGGDRDQLHRGYYMWNSEVGDTTVYIDAFYFRECCGNLQIWGKESVLQFKLRHTKGAPLRFEEINLPDARAWFQSSALEDEAMIRKAKRIDIPSDRTLLVDFISGKGFTKSFAGQSIDKANEEEGDCSNVWNLFQGMTATARDLPLAQDRIQVSKQAGAFLSAQVA